MKYYIYKYYINNELVYIGRTNNILFRYKAHLNKRDKNYLEFQKITNIHVAEFVSDADMMIYEKYYITKYHPKFNIVDIKWDIPTIELPEPIWHIYTPDELIKAYNDGSEIKTIHLTQDIIKKDKDNDKKDNYCISNINIINVSDISQEELWDKIYQYDLMQTAFIFPCYNFPLQFVKNDGNYDENINDIYKVMVYPLLSGKQNEIIIPYSEIEDPFWLKLYYSKGKSFASFSLDEPVIITKLDNQYKYKIRSKEANALLYNNLFNK